MYSTELTSTFPATWKWQRLHSIKLQILPISPITCKLDVKLKMMWWTPINRFTPHVTSQTELIKTIFPRVLSTSVTPALCLSRAWKAGKDQTEIWYVPTYLSSEETVKRQQTFKCTNNKQLLDKAKYQNIICLYSQQNNSTSSPGVLG